VTCSGQILLHNVRPARPLSGGTQLRRTTAHFITPTAAACLNSDDLEVAIECHVPKVCDERLGTRAHAQDEYSSLHTGRALGRRIDAIA